MTAHLSPYLSFNGNAREAMEFYQQRLRRRTLPDPVPGVRHRGSGAGRQDHARHAAHRRRGSADGLGHAAGDAEIRRGNTNTLCLSGDDADKLRRWWEQLSAGGVVKEPLEKQVWGDEYGECEDRFGTPWMIDIGQSPS